MIRKLRIKFIAIVMASLILILSAIMVGINLINYSQVSRSADQMIDIIVDNNGKLPEPNIIGKTMYESEAEISSQDDNQDIILQMNPETPFDTRFFTAIIYNGQVVSTDVSYTASFTKIEASSKALSLYNSGRERGYDGVYRFRVHQSMDSSYLVIYLDYSRQLEPTQNFMFNSLWIAAAGILAAFAVVFFISKLVVKPVEESVSKQKRFVTDAAHELKTPLTIISANNELLQIENGGNEMTSVIDKEVRKMNDMVKDMTALSKLDEISRKDFESFSLTEAAHDVSSSFINAFAQEKKGFDIKIDDSIEFKGNQSQIRKLLSILIDNSLKYSVRHAEIHVYKNGSHTNIDVDNDAENITQGSKEKAFERFYRSDEARGSKVQGSGIGLSIAKEIVLIHKGRITAYSYKDNTFSIRVSF